jgi:hypothetical protein
MFYFFFLLCVGWGKIFVLGPSASLAREWRYVVVIFGCAFGGRGG